MIAFQLNGLPLDQISTADDSIESSELVGSIDPNSPAFTLMDGIVRKIATAALLPEIEAKPLPDCASVVSWVTIATQLGLPLVSVSNRDAPVNHSADSGSRSPYDVALNAAGSQAAERQGVRRCYTEIGIYVYDEQTRPIYVWAEFVPEGAWVRDSGLWLGWDQEDCHGFEGGPACEYSWMSPSGVAAHVRVQGGIINDEGPAGFGKLVEENLL